MKKLLALIFALSGLFSSDTINGFWKTIDEKTGKAQSIIAVYQYDGKYYGRIIAAYDEQGQIDDSIYKPKSRAPGVEGEPFYSGLDIIWSLSLRGSRYKGKILDPREGNIYNAELWVHNGNLIVRGKLFFFGRNQSWLPATAADFPANFAIPDTSKFIPAIPTPK